VIQQQSCSSGQAGTHKGADERWRKSFNGYPLTTGCGDRILYPEHPTRSLEVRGLQASVSPTLFVEDPGAASATA